MNDRQKKLIEKVKVIKTAQGISDSRKNTSSDNDVNESVWTLNEWNLFVIAQTKIEWVKKKE